MQIVGAYALCPKIIRHCLADCVKHYLPYCVTCAITFCALPIGAQSQQNPSPMVEHTRAHPRLEQTRPRGKRSKLSTGTLFVPAALAKGESALPLIFHFHGAEWLPEACAEQYGRAAVVTVQLGSGSSAYARPFQEEPGLFDRMLREAEQHAQRPWQSVTLSAWSAGYGAIREILSQPSAYQRVAAVLLVDGLHTSYVHGQPGPLESELETAGLEVFLRFASDASAGKKRLMITHTEIFPGTFASTTETADFLLRELGLPRRAILRWGPMQTQQLSEVRQGRFLLQGFAGNAAPDHVDQLHSLSEYWRQLDELSEKQLVPQ